MLQGRDDPTVVVRDKSTVQFKAAHLHILHPESVGETDKY